MAYRIPLVDLGRVQKTFSAKSDLLQTSPAQKFYRQVYECLL